MKRSKPYHRTLIECSKIRPHVKELVDRCGSINAAAKYALVGNQTILNVLNNKYCAVQRETARKFLLALEHRREEDRLNNAVHKRLLKARQAQARIEDQQERLIGY
jgi:hypothetical protein